MSHSTKQSEIISSLRSLSIRNEQLVSTTIFKYESIRHTTLNILEELERTREMHKKSSQRSEDRDQMHSMQLNQLFSNLKDLMGIGERSATEHRILESLYYQRMEDRQEKIVDAHAQTFEWIFDTHSLPSGRYAADNFLEWLVNGNDIFWITGKPGSGKSTLMKFLSHHPSSTSALQQWADKKNLITASFYFWHAGSELQKSQEGLLQSLLYNIFSQCPESMPQVLSKRWEQCTRSPHTFRRWTRTELLDTFAELSLRATLEKRFCFFIDGLDEYDCDHTQVVDLVKGLAQSKDIKICLSSRPWNTFIRAFGQGSHPTMHLEDLTRRDIASYVGDTLGSNRFFCQLAAGKDSDRCKELSSSIVSRAQGVFLWVFLVVNSLLEGLTNADRITDLERRLQSLPTDLEAYFRHMLETIDEVYKKQTVQTFHIALHAAEPLSLMTYAMIDEVEENPEYAIELPVQQMTTTEIESRCQEMKLRINARCKDLLHITRKPSQNSHHEERPRVNSMLPEPKSPSDDLSPKIKSPLWFLEPSSVRLAGSAPIPVPQYMESPLFQYEVDFLHRTVKDFFQVNNVQSFLASRTSESFNCFALLCHATLALIKIMPIELRHFHQRGELSALIDDLMHYAHEAETQTAHPSIALLDELSEVIKLQHASLQVRGLCGFMEEVSVGDPSIKTLCQSFLGFAVQRDLKLYVSCKLDERQRQGQPAWANDELVLDALWRSDISKYPLQSPNRTMLRLLVDKGVDLNRVLGPRSMWDHTIELICLRRPCSDSSTNDHNLEIVAALLDVGAEPNRSHGSDRLRWVDFLLVPRENWSSRSSDFEAALTKTILAICERGVDPYWEFAGRTLWSHFIRSINDENRTSKPLSLQTKGFILSIIQKFISLGARLDDLIDDNIIEYEDGEPVYVGSLTVTDVLNRVFTKAEVESMKPLQRRVKAESSKATTTAAQRRKKKKKNRKERKKSGV